MPLPSLSTPIGNTGISIDPSKAARTALLVAKGIGRKPFGEGGMAEPEQPASQSAATPNSSPALAQPPRTYEDIMSELQDIDARSRAHSDAAYATAQGMMKTHGAEAAEKYYTDAAAHADAMRNSPYTASLVEQATAIKRAEKEAEEAQRRRYDIISLLRGKEESARKAYESASRMPRPNKKNTAAMKVAYEGAQKKRADFESQGLSRGGHAQGATTSLHNAGGGDRQRPKAAGGRAGSADQGASGAHEGRLNRDAGGQALKQAINNFSQARNAEFDGSRAPASADTKLLQAMLWPQQHQLAVAEAPQQRPQPMAQNMGDLGDEIERGAKFLKGEPADDDDRPVAGQPSKEAVVNAATGHQNGNAPPLVTTRSFEAPYNGSLSPQQRDLMIRTVAGEAGNQGPVGQAAVAHVILNRAMDSRWGKDGIDGVILAPLQFSTWNKGDPAGAYARSLSPDSKTYQSIGQIIDGTVSGDIPDPTRGATYFYAPRGGYGMKAGTVPSWAPEQAQQNDITIGGHRFLGRSNFDMQPQPTESAEESPHATQPVETAPLPPPQAAPQPQAPPSSQLNNASAGPQAMADPMSDMYDRIAFSPDVQAGYDNPQVMFDPNSAPSAARGGKIRRASGGPAYASMPTNELIDKALNIIRRRRAASGGSQSSSWGSQPDINNPSITNSRAMQNMQQQARDLALGEQISGNANGYNGAGSTFGANGPQRALDIASQLDSFNTTPQTGPTTASTPPTPDNTPAVSSGTVGNQGTPSGAPLGAPPSTGPTSYSPPQAAVTGPTSPIPMASPTGFNGYNYNNSLDEVLGTNAPTSNQIFGFNYPQNLPAPKPQPVGPVSQDEINGLYGYGGGVNGQMGTGTYNSGGAVLMDALNRARKARRGGGRLSANDMGAIMQNLPNDDGSHPGYYNDGAKNPADYAPIPSDSRIGGYDRLFNNPPQPDADWSARDSDYRSYPILNQQAIRRGGAVKGKR